MAANNPPGNSAMLARLTRALDVARASAAAAAALPAAAAAPVQDEVIQVAGGSITASALAGMYNRQANRYTEFRLNYKLIQVMMQSMTGFPPRDAEAGLWRDIKFDDVQGAQNQMERIEEAKSALPEDANPAQRIVPWTVKERLTIEACVFMLQGFPKSYSVPQRATYKQALNTVLEAEHVNIQLDDTAVLLDRAYNIVRRVAGNALPPPPPMPPPPPPPPSDAAIEELPIFQVLDRYVRNSKIRLHETHLALGNEQARHENIARLQKEIELEEAKRQVLVQQLTTLRDQEATLLAAWVGANQSMAEANAKYQVGGDLAVLQQLRRDELSIWEQLKQQRRLRVECQADLETVEQKIENLQQELAMLQGNAN